MGVCAGGGKQCARVSISLFGQAPKVLPSYLGAANPGTQDVLLDLLHGQGQPRAATTSGPHSWTTAMDCASPTIIVPESGTVSS